MELHVNIFIIVILCTLIETTANENILIKNVTNVLNTARTLDNVNGSFAEKIKNVGELAETFTEMIAPALQNLQEDKNFIGLKSISPEDVSLLKSLVIQVDREIKGLSADFKDMIHKMEEQRIQMQLGNTEQKIRVAAQELEILHSVPTDAFSEQVNLFILNYESDFQNSAKKLLKSIMSDKNIFYKSIFDIALPLTEYNREMMQLFMMSVLKLLLQGVNVEMSYLIVKNYSESYKYMKHDWGQKIRHVTSHITQVDQIVKSKWREQSEIDVTHLAESKSSLDHYSFAHLLYSRLQEKYPWRHWFTVVYDPIDGPDNHWMCTCGGFTKFRFHGRNIVVASVDENKPYLDKAQGVDILASLPPSVSAEDFFYSLPENITRTCEWYASSGCLRFGFKGFHVGHVKRTVLVARSDSEMTLHLFG